MNLCGIRAFIFDMDGTLIDSMRYWRGENRRFLARHGLPIPEDIAPTIDVMSSHAFGLRMVRDAPQRFRYEEIIAEYEDEMEKKYASIIPAKPGAAEFLDFLESRGYVLCVATATRRSTACMALDRQGFLEKMDFVTDGSDIGLGKGDPEYFRRLAAKLGVQPQECVLFEDSLYAMQGGKAAGLTVFAIEEFVYLHDEETMRAIAQTADLFVKDFYAAKRAMEAAPVRKRTAGEEKTN